MTTARGASRRDHNFASLPSVNIPRSTFNRTSGLKTAFDSAYLVPIYLDEALPGDTFNMDMAAFVRMATPIFPVMDDFFVDTFFFAVPNRLLWDNWERFNGAQDNPGDTTDYEIPQVSEVVVTEESVYEYMGLPIGFLPYSFNALPFRALNLIYNDWFRSEDLIDSMPVPTDDGPDDNTNYKLLKRTKRHDYFTSALPAPQKGPAIPILIGGTVPVVPALTGVPTFTGSGLSGDSPLSTINASANVFFDQSAGATGAVAWNQTALEVDLDEGTSNTINELREAFQTQKILERDARGGTRYTEILRSHFGVVSPDARLQRPEYLGGSSTRINVSPVAQSVDQGVASSTEPLGRLGGFATASERGVRWMKSFTEHCYIIGLANVRAKLTYQQGVERMFSRKRRFDFFWPAFSHLGEQAVLNKEIYCQATPAQDDLPFGYVPRFDEYRYKPSRVSGKMRSNAVGNLDSWHLALNFLELPVLNQIFIEEAPPFDRVVAVPSEPEFIADFHFDLKCTRPMPTHAVPGLIDHF